MVLILQVCEDGWVCERKIELGGDWVCGGREWLGEAVVGRGDVIGYRDLVHVYDLLWSPSR